MLAGEFNGISMVYICFVRPLLIASEKKLVASEAKHVQWHFVGIIMFSFVRS